MAGKEEVYEVEKILDARIRGRTNEYLIRWKGFDSSEDSWEPEKNLVNCSAYLSQFKEMIAQQKAASPSRTPRFRTPSRSRSRSRGRPKAPKNESSPPKATLDYSMSSLRRRTALDSPDSSSKLIGGGEGGSHSTYTRRAVVTHVTSSGDGDHISADKLKQKMSEIRESLKSESPQTMRTVKPHRSRQIWGLLSPSDLLLLVVLLAGTTYLLWHYNIISFDCINDVIWPNTNQTAGEVEAVRDDPVLRIPTPSEESHAIVNDKEHPTPPVTQSPLKHD